MATSMQSAQALIEKIQSLPTDRIAEGENNWQRVSRFSSGRSRFLAGWVKPTPGGYVW